jgi:hypothetical protein
MHGNAPDKAGRILPTGIRPPAIPRVMDSGFAAARRPGMTSSTAPPTDRGAYLGENASSLKGDVSIGDILGSLIAMKPKPAA